MRATLLAVFGVAALRLLFIIFWCMVALLCLRSDATSQLRQRAWCCSSACSACLDYLSSLSPFGNVLVIFFIIFPPVFVRQMRRPEGRGLENACMHTARGLTMCSE